jgi:hypothetical protein
LFRKVLKSYNQKEHESMMSLQKGQELDSQIEVSRKVYED